MLEREREQRAGRVKRERERSREEGWSLDGGREGRGLEILTRTKERERVQVYTCGKEGQEGEEREGW